MKSNKGYSLVELLITVTILAIVIMSAAAFMATGSRSFAKGNADSNVLNAAELAVNQMVDTIIGVNGGVDFVDDGTTATLTLYHAEDDENGLTTYKKKTITWHEDVPEPYIDYNEWNLNYDDTADAYTESASPYTDQILAENVTDFKVDLSDTTTETDAYGNPKRDKDGNFLVIIKSVQVEISCLDGTGKSAYASSPVITLRNRMMNSDSPGAIFAEAPTSDDAISLFYSAAGVGGAELPIVNRVTEVQKGGIYNIVARNMGNDVTSEFNFTLEAGSSTISGGNLKVDESETETYLTITATAVYNSSKKATAVFKVAGDSMKSLDSVTIIPSSLNPFSAEYTSVVAATGMSDAEINNLEYNWYLIGENVANKLTREVTNGGKDIKINVLQENGHYKSTGDMFDVMLVVRSGALNQSISAMVNYWTDSEDTLSGDSLIVQGKNADSEYRYSLPDGVDRVEYEHYFCHIDGKRMTAQEKFNDYVEVQGGNGSYRLHFLRELPPQNEYYLKVVVNAIRTDGTIMEGCYERIHYIPAVRLWGETTGAGAAGGSSNFYYSISGYDIGGWASQVEYEVVDLVYDALEGVTVTAVPSGAGSVSGTRMRGTVAFNSSNGGADIKIKSVKVKISMKNYPDIYTYATVNFS